MAWICKNFFTVLNSDDSKENALQKAINNAEYYQNIQINDYVYVVYLDLKHQRFGIVFSEKSFLYLKQLSIVSSQFEIMSFTEMIQTQLQQSDQAPSIVDYSLTEEEQKKIVDEILSKNILPTKEKIQEDSVIQVTNAIDTTAIADAIQQSILNRIDTDELISQATQSILPYVLQQISIQQAQTDLIKYMSDIVLAKEDELIADVILSITRLIYPYINDPTKKFLVTEVGEEGSA